MGALAFAVCNDGWACAMVNGDFISEPEEYLQTNRVSLRRFDYEKSLNPADLVFIVHTNSELCTSWLRPEHFENLKCVVVSERPAVQIMSTLLPFPF
jgi:hypothetical protein